MEVAAEAETMMATAEGGVEVAKKSTTSTWAHRSQARPLECLSAFLSDYRRRGRAAPATKTPASIAFLLDLREKGKRACNFTKKAEKSIEGRSCGEK